ncbi:hypothetical protein FKM82_022425 [Ascaphus truei]
MSAPLFPQEKWLNPALVLPCQRHLVPVGFPCSRVRACFCGERRRGVGACGYLGWMGQILGLQNPLPGDFITFLPKMCSTVSGAPEREVRKALSDPCVRSDGFLVEE